MSVHTQHTSYIRYLPKWQLMRDCNAGSDMVKSKKDLYLPCPSGMHGEAGRYNSYVERAEFPSLVSEAIVGKALVMKRFRPRARGRAAKILKPFSNISIVVREREGE